MSVDFNSLPKPNFVDVLDYEAILNERKEYFISLHSDDEQVLVRKTLNRESEPVTKLLQENAYREMILRNQINEKHWLLNWLLQREMILTFGAQILMLNV